MLTRPGERPGRLGLDDDLGEVPAGEAGELLRRERAGVRGLGRDEAAPFVASAASIAGASLSRRIEATIV